MYLISNFLFFFLVDQAIENFNYVSISAMEEDQEFVENEMDQDAEDMNIVDEDDLFDLHDYQEENFICNYSITVEKQGKYCQTLIDKYHSLRGTPEFYKTQHPLRQDIERGIRRFHNLKQNLQDPANRNLQEVNQLLYKNPTRLPLKSRWTLYWSWVAALQEYLAKQLEELERRYRNKTNQYQEFKQLEDLNIVQNADIIGMTTTGAASMNLLLKSLKPVVGKFRLTVIPISVYFHLSKNFNIISEAVCHSSSCGFEFQ